MPSSYRLVTREVEALASVVTRLERAGAPTVWASALALATATGITADPWQADLLCSVAPRVLVNCSRQSGKSTMFALLGLYQSLGRPRSTTLMLSPGQRQSMELLGKVAGLLRVLGGGVRTDEESKLRMTFPNGSRIIALPAKESTIRGYTVDLLLADEAAMIEDGLYHAVRPMLAVSGGRLLAGSTPHGKRGWWYDEWHSDRPWKRVEIPAHLCPRIAHEFLAEERRGNPLYLQEYECQFLDDERAAFRTDDIAAAQVDGLTSWEWAVGR